MCTNKITDLINFINNIDLNSSASISILGYELTSFLESRYVLIKKDKRKKNTLVNLIIISVIYCICKC